MFSNNNTTVTRSTSIVATLDLIRERFVGQLPLIFVIIGSIGFIGNVFTFLQPNLRRNTFCIYSLCRSIIDIINLFINLFPNYLYTPDDIFFKMRNSQLCKLKLFGLVFIPQLSINFLLLSIMDRYICTCPIRSPLRALHQLKIVPYQLVIGILISGLMSVYTPFLYDIVPDFGCIPTKPFLYSMLYIVIHGFLTPLVMLFFVYLTYQNVKKNRKRSGVLANSRTYRTRYQFIRMVFIQVITTSFFLLQWISFYIYYASTQHINKSLEQRTIDYFLISLTNSLYYIINIKSFYLSTLTSRLFRKTLVESLWKLLQSNRERSSARVH